MTLEEAKTKVFHTSSQRELFWFGHTDKALNSIILRRSYKRELESLLFNRAVPMQLSYSNQHVRHASRRAIFDVAVNFHAHDPSQPVYLATFAGERGATVLSSPEFDMVAFQRAVDAILRRLGLSGFFVFEFDIVLRRPPATDWIMLFHCHGLVRPLNPATFNLREVEKELAGSPAFPWWHRAKGADIREIKPTSLDFARVAVYLADPFHQLKREQPRRGQSETKMRSTRDKLTPKLVLRATEIQSYLPLRDMVFGVGPFGKGLRAEWLQGLRANLPAEAANGPFLTQGDIEALWQQTRADSDLAQFGPSRIRTRSAMLLARKHL
jgi:hypothetical protein